MSNSLAKVHPELVSEWSERNFPLTPDSVSASYVLPADKIATVKVGSTTVVEMHNELRDTPKTGDNSNVGLWTALAGLSALGIVGTAVVAYRKKKKEDNE